MNSCVPLNPGIFALHHAQCRLEYNKWKWTEIGNAENLAALRKTNSAKCDFPVQFLFWQKGISPPWEKNKTIIWSNFHDKQQQQRKNEESWPVEETLGHGIKRRHLPERLVSAVQLHPCDQDAKGSPGLTAVGGHNRSPPPPDALMWAKTSGHYGGSLVYLYIYFSIHLFEGSGRFQAPSVGKLHPAGKKKVSAEEKTMHLFWGGDEKCLSDLKCLTGRTKWTRQRQGEEFWTATSAPMYFPWPK